MLFFLDTRKADNIFSETENKILKAICRYFYATKMTGCLSRWKLHYLSSNSPLPESYMLHNSQEGEKQRAASLEWTKRLPFLLIMITATTIGSEVKFLQRHGTEAYIQRDPSTNVV